MHGALNWKVNANILTIFEIKILHTVRVKNTLKLYVSIYVEVVYQLCGVSLLLTLYYLYYIPPLSLLWALGECLCPSLGYIHFLCIHIRLKYIFTFAYKYKLSINYSLAYQVAYPGQGVLVVSGSGFSKFGRILSEHPDLKSI